MSKILKNRVFGRLSMILAIMMIMPIIAPVYGAEKPVNQVVISNVQGDSKISAGKGDGMNVGDKGVIVRDGKEVANFEVTNVEWGYSGIKLSGLASGEMLRVGDAAQVTTHAKPGGGQSIKKSNSGAKALLALLVVGAVVALSSGGGHGGGGSSSSGVQSVSLATTKTSLPADGASTATITATIADGNNAAVPDGTVVQFSSNAGTISPAQSVTSGGKATATLTAGTTVGPVTVTASAGGKTSTITISLTQSTGTVGSIGLTASPTTIQVIGSGGAQTQSTITATCRDAQGNLATSGTVIFTSSLGSVVGTVPVDVNGVATSTFSSNATGQATITASWTGAESSVTVNVTAGPPYAINVICAPTAVQCDGHSFATVTATVKDVAGNLVTDGTVVDFAVQADANGGGNGTITAQGRTSAGVATATLFSRTPGGLTSIPGTATVVASVLSASQPAGIPVPAVDITNHATQVQLVSLDVAEIHVGATVSNVRGWDVVNNTTTIGAVVYDSHHNPVPDGTAVYFTANHGMIYGNSGTAGNVTMSTTLNGRASATLVTDGAGDSSWNGLVTITTTSGTVTVTSPGLVIFSGWPSYTTSSAEMSSTTLQSVMDGATITVTALDVNGNPVVDDTKVTAVSTKGTLKGDGKTMGGVALFTLQTSTDMASPTATGAGTVTITVDSGGQNPETGGSPLIYTLGFTVVP